MVSSQSVPIKSSHRELGNIITHLMLKLNDVSLWMLLFCGIKLECLALALEAQILICILSSESQSHVKGLKHHPPTPSLQRRPALNEFFPPSFNEGQERVTSFPL